MRRTLFLLLSIIVSGHAGADLLLANDSESPAVPLRSLHGTMITVISEDQGLPMEIWAKDNYFRSELRMNGNKIISIQRGNRIYTYGEGSTSGDVTGAMRGLGSMPLIKQIEEVKTLGKVRGSVQIDGKIHDIYLYDVNAPRESAIVHLCRETSLPRLWISVIQTSEDNAEAMRMILRDMEANVDIPDKLFEVPSNVRFSVTKVGEAGEIKRERVVEPKSAKAGDISDQAILAVVVSEIAEVRTRDKVVAKLHSGDVARIIRKEESRILVETSEVRGWVGRQDLIPMESAETYFNAKLNVDPNDVTALSGRAKMIVWLAEQSNLRGTQENALLELAVLDLNRLVKLAPSAEVFATRGRALDMMRNYQPAIDDFNTAIEMDPDNVDVMRKRAALSILLDNVDVALDDCNALIRLNAKDAKAHSLRCYVLGVKGQLDEAMLSCNTAVELDEEFANAYLRRGTIWSALKDDTRAKADYDTAIRLGDDSARIVRARVLMRQGKPREAIADLDVVIKLYPEHWYLYQDRGSIWIELGDFDKAIEDLSKVIEHQPTSVPALANRGLARAQKGDHDKAIEDFSAAIKLNPESQRLYAYRAQLYAGKQAHLRAIEDYTKLIEMSPNDANAYVERGLSYYFTQQYSNAIRDLDSAVKLTPDDTRIYMLRGSARSGAEDFEGAIDDFSRVIDAVPQAADAFTYRGTARFRLMQHEKAIADFDKAVELAPSFDQALVNRGAYWSSMREYGKAIADWTEAWRLNPRRTETANELARLFAACPDAKYRDSKRAIELAQRCCELTDWSHHEYLETLAIAYAESKDFESAVKWMRKSLEQSPADHQQEAQQRLNNYLQGETFRIGETNN